MYNQYNQKALGLPIFDELRHGNILLNVSGPKRGSDRLVTRDDVLVLGGPVEVAGDAGDREHVRPLQAISSTSSLSGMMIHWLNLKHNHDP